VQNCAQIPALMLLLSPTILTRSSWPSKESAIRELPECSKTFATILIRLSAPLQSPWTIRPSSFLAWYLLMNLIECRNIALFWLEDGYHYHLRQICSSRPFYRYTFDRYRTERLLLDSRQISGTFLLIILRRLEVVTAISVGFPYLNEIDAICSSKIVSIQ
jgi:hypothetical protein